MFPHHQISALVCSTLLHFVFTPEDGNIVAEKRALSLSKFFQFWRGFFATITNTYEVFPHMEIITKVGSELCSDGAPTQELCVAVFKFVAGLNEKEMNKTLIPLVTTHAPSGGSVKQSIHFSQGLLSGHFRKYDYGVNGNLEKYGTPTPPDYGIENITAPVALFYSSNDLFANIQDVELLAQKLPNVVKKHLVEDEGFTHLDFGLAIHAVELVYEKVLDVMNKY